jgi:methylase of polypeptide subunit release factors
MTDFMLKERIHIPTGQDDLREETLMVAREEQIRRQIEYHRVAPPHETVKMRDGPVELSVHQTVMRPLSSRLLADYALGRPELFRGRTVADIGCGTGLQGIVAAQLGASEILFTDINPNAVANARDNAQALNVENASFLMSDYWESIPDGREFDTIMFTPPYFDGCPDCSMSVEGGMLSPDDDIYRFYNTSMGHLNKGGVILTMHWRFASDKKDPRNISLPEGLSLTKSVQIYDDSTIQAGWFDIFEIKLQN